MSSPKAPPHPPILDTHVHLFPADQLINISWANPTHPLNSSHTPSEYKPCIPPSLKPYHRGLVFVELDYNYTDPPLPNPTASDLHKAWQYVLGEYSYVLSLSRLSSICAGPGHVRGLVAWAPIHLGVEMLQRHFDMLCAIGGIYINSATGKVERKRSILKGYRQLLQDKPRGWMLRKEFLDGLRWMARKGLSFDVGVDVRGTGLWQLEELADVVMKLGEEAPMFIIDHLAKPNLHIPPNCDSLPSNPNFATFSHLLTTIAQASHAPIFVKLSGALCELPSQIPPLTQNEIVDHIYPWLALFVKTLSVRSVIWGSDWPVCNVGYNENLGGVASGGGADAWRVWADITESLMKRFVVEGLLPGGKEEVEEAVKGIWGGNGKVAYEVEWDE